MNKIIASTGLVALGAAAFAPGLSAQNAAKSWNVHAGVQGFYDSNNTLLSDSLNPEGSWGVGLTAGAGYNLPLDQTFFGVDYTYGMKWYEAREDNEVDQSHAINLKLDHSISEQYEVSVKDSFVFSAEPTVLDAGGPVTAPTRVARTDQDNIRNRANVDFMAQFSERWGASIGYENLYYNYSQDAGDVPATSVSRSQLLDRMQHLVPIDLRYTLNPQLIGLVGYQYGMVNFQDDDTYTNPVLGTVSPDWRNNQQHYFYVGAEYAVSSKLNAALKAGGQYTVYDNLTDYAAAATYDDTQLTPYVDLSASYLYNPGSFLTAGYSYSLTPTDLQILDNRSHVFYVSATHRVTARVDLNFLYQFQYSTFNANDNVALSAEGNESFNMLGIDFDYKITEYLSGQLGYKLDDLDSDVAGRGYTRHIGFVGIRVHY